MGLFVTGIIIGILGVVWFIKTEVIGFNKNAYIGLSAFIYCLHRHTFRVNCGTTVVSYAKTFAERANCLRKLIKREPIAEP